MEMRRRGRRWVAGGGGGPANWWTVTLSWRGELGREGRKRATARPRAARWRDSSMAGKVWPLLWKGTTSTSPSPGDDIASVVDEGRGETEEEGAYMAKVPSQPSDERRL